MVIGDAAALGYLVPQKSKIMRILNYYHYYHTIISILLYYQQISDMDVKNVKMEHFKLWKLY